MIRLLTLRNEKGYSQREMAKFLNVSQGTYNNWENSNTQPSIEQLIELAKFFNVSVDYLIGNSDETGSIAYDVKGYNDENIIAMYNAASPQLQSAIKVILQEVSEKDK